MASRRHTLSPLDTVKINPSTSYLSDCVQWEEDFSGGIGTSFHQNLFEFGIDMLSDTTVKSQNGSGEVILDGEKVRFECTTDPMFLPKDRRVYIEMDYKCNTPFFVNFDLPQPMQVQYGNALKEQEEEQNLHFSF